MRLQTKERKSRFQTPVGEVSKTDQSAKKACCINNMIKKFKNTGIPPVSNKSGIFADVSNIGSLSEMYELSTIASNAFQELPARVRKLMNNDPSKLEEFVLDEKNAQICIENGLLISKEKEKAVRKRGDGVGETSHSKNSEAASTEA